ncbi:MAG: hypothetical protein C4324_07400 [Blastocatellia bacterium]
MESCDQRQSNILRRRSLTNNFDASITYQKTLLTEPKSIAKLPDGRIYRDTEREQKQKKYAFFARFAQVDFLTQNDAARSPTQSLKQKLSCNRRFN